MSTSMHASPKAILFCFLNNFIPKMTASVKNCLAHTHETGGNNWFSFSLPLPNLLMRLKGPIKAKVLAQREGSLLLHCCAMTLVAEIKYCCGSRGQDRSFQQSCKRIFVFKVEK